MGAFKIEVTLHDAELEEFIRQAFAEDLTAAAEYVARRIVDEVPELDPNRTTVRGVITAACIGGACELCPGVSDLGRACTCSHHRES